jgi:hypothetical protein
MTTHTRHPAAVALDQVCDELDAKYGGKLADPDFRTERARKAGRARQQPAALARTLMARVDEVPDAEANALLRTLLNSLARRKNTAGTTAVR